MERIIITCNECGLEKGRHDEGYKSEAWLTLKNIDLSIHITNCVRLDGEHHFCSFGCLNIWSDKASEAVQRIVKAAEGISPRGTLTNDDLGLHY